MSQFLNFGNSSDGPLSITTPTTHAPIDSSCSGTGGTTSLTATNVSFTAGQFILIHQSRGANAGYWEMNKIASYTAGTITTSFPLTLTYQDGGVSQAQVIVMPQYSGITISSILTAKAWNENVGGIIPFLCNGCTNISGSITANGKGYLGAASVSGIGLAGGQGEGTSGPRGTISTAANGNGGGGGYTSGYDNASGGGGGGYANNGTDGAPGQAAPGGTGGISTGNTSLTTMSIGGGGGTGGSGRYGATISGAGANGGGIILIYSQKIIVSGGIYCNGDNGGIVPTGAAGGGGGGAGGSIFLKGQELILGTSLITADKGTGGFSNAGVGGAGSIGRIRIETCSRTGSTNPAASESIGGYTFCGSLAAIL